jgi:hypothetical protein
LVRSDPNFGEPSKLPLKASINKGLGGKSFNDHPNWGWVESGYFRYSLKWIESDSSRARVRSVDTEDKNFPLVVEKIVS